MPRLFAPVGCWRRAAQRHVSGISRTHMQLTTRETKLVERLRKQEQQWLRVRWFLLGAGVISALCSTFIAITLSRHVVTMLAEQDDFMSRGWLFALAVFWPICLILLAPAAVFIFGAIRDWHGNTTRLLLLKLLEPQERGEAR